jgi:hypothetical protein
VIDYARDVPTERFQEFITLHPGLLHHVPDRTLSKGGFKLSRWDCQVRTTTDPGVRDIFMNTVLEVADSIV